MLLLKALKAAGERRKGSLMPTPPSLMEPGANPLGDGDVEQSTEQSASSARRSGGCLGGRGGGEGEGERGGGGGGIMPGGSYLAPAEADRRRTRAVARAEANELGQSLSAQSSLRRQKSGGHKAASRRANHVSWRTFRPVGASGGWMSCRSVLARKCSHLSGPDGAPVGQSSLEASEGSLRGLVGATHRPVVDEESSQVQGTVEGFNLCSSF